MNTSSMSTLALAVATITTLTLVGCATPAPRTAPATLIAPQSLGLSGAALIPAESNWWQRFGDAQLNDLIAQGNAHSPTLAQAAARLRAAQANVAASHADLLPSITGNGLAGYGRSAKYYQVPPPMAGQVGSLGDVNAGLTWSLDLWGRTAQLEAASQADADASDMALAQARLLLTSAIVQTYIEYQRATTAHKLALDAIATQQDQLHLLRQRVDAALDARDDLETSTRKLAEQRATDLRAKASAQLAANTLLTLSGSSSAASRRLAAPHLDYAAGLPLPQQLPINLLARRPDIIAARLKVNAAAARQQAAIKAFYPTVDLQALAGFATFDISNLFHAASRNWSTGAAISLPIFDAGRLRAAQHSSEAQQDGDIAAYNDTVLAAVQQSVDQLTQITAIGDQQQQQHIASSAADSAWQLAHARNTALLDGRLPTLHAELDRIALHNTDNALAADLALAKVRLLTAVGGSFDLAVHPYLTARTGATQP